MDDGGRDGGTRGTNVVCICRLFFIQNSIFKENMVLSILFAIEFLVVQGTSFLVERVWIISLFGKLSLRNSGIWNFILGYFIEWNE
jgi:hypothetical protein